MFITNKVFTGEDSGLPINSLVSHNISKINVNK